MKTFLFVRNNLKKPPTRLQSVTTHFSRKLSHPRPNIKQSILHSLTSKTNFTHYDYKPSNPKKFFFQKCPTFPSFPKSPLTIRNQILVRSTIMILATVGSSPLSTLHSLLSTLPSPLEFLSPENNCPL